ncbi:hypothetical protein [Paraburkholderia caffeinilytica]|uniref:hypothetical protein n=1 Tax=Paraburkholderia caffeinilytica TaxID=1761016 RepID=UPI003DA06FEC
MSPDLAALLNTSDHILGCSLRAMQINQFYEAILANALWDGIWNELMTTSQQKTDSDVKNLPIEAFVI